MSFGLYVHIPYCRSKCAYCDFNSYPASSWPEDDYVAALCAELEHYARRSTWAGSRVATVYIGGGTPSLFAPGSIASVIEAADKLFGIESGAEVTLEANPGTVDGARLRGYRAAGVNRLSLGVQSFSSRHLALLGRAHSPQEARAAVGAARAGGFAELSIDLIFALPGQRLGEWEQDLAAAVALGPEHLSVYNLTYEAGTDLFARRARGELAALGEEEELAMYVAARNFLAAAGYEHYEISNYARPGHACRHNCRYWLAEDYLGIGAGAHSFRRRPGYGERWANERVPERYLALVAERGTAAVAGECLGAAQAMGEFCFLGLRLLAGLEVGRFERRFGRRLEEVYPQVAELLAEGLLQRENGRLRLAERGLAVADSVFAAFV